MNALLRRARRLARAGGIPGIIAAGLFAFCAAVLLSAVAPLLARERQAQAEQQRLAALERDAGTKRASASTPADQLARFYLFFGSTEERTEMLARIHKLARDQGLELQQGSYRLGGGRSERLARYELSLPLRGTYPQIRAFAAAVLNEVPSAALEQVSFEKQKIGDPGVEVQFKLALFLDSAPRPGR